MSEPILERRQSDVIGTSWATLCLGSALAVTLLMTVAGVSIVLVRPELSDSPAVRRLGYFLALIIAALFAGAGINIASVLDGHTSAMIRLVGEKKHAEGVIEGLKANPDIPLS